MAVFASGVAHDINNVALPLGMRVEVLLANANLDQKVKGELGIIWALVDQLRMISRNLSLFSLDADREGVELSTNLHSWCSQMKRLIADSLGARGGTDGTGPFHLEWDFPADLPAVRVAPHRVTQAILNLVHNTRDAIAARRQGKPTRDTGRITISASARPDGTAVLLKVVDYGSKAVDQAGECETVTLESGAVGGVNSDSRVRLDFVRAVCARVGGMLDVKATAGKGTMFMLTLPAISLAGPTLRQTV